MSITGLCPHISQKLLQMFRYRANNCFIPSMSSLLLWAHLKPEIYLSASEKGLLRRSGPPPLPSDGGRCLPLSRWHPAAAPHSCVGRCLAHSSHEETDAQKGSALPKSAQPSQELGS